MADYVDRVESLRGVLVQMRREELSCIGKHPKLLAEPCSDIPQSHTARLMRIQSFIRLVDEIIADEKTLQPSVFEMEARIAS